MLLVNSAASDFGCDGSGLEHPTVAEQTGLPICVFHPTWS